MNSLDFNVNMLNLQFVSIFSNFAWHVGENADLGQRRQVV